VADSSIAVASIAATAAVVGGGLWTFLSNWLNIGQSSRKDALTRLDGEVSKLSEELSTCEARHGVLETRLRAVEQRNGSYFALWIKDRHRRLVWLNDKAFLTLFAPLGYARDELDGKTFADLLDPVAAAEIENLDRVALAHPGATQSVLVQLHPDLQFMVVIKVAAIAENGDVQYEGCAYSPGDPDIRAANGVRRQVEQLRLSADNLMPGD